MGRTVLGLVRVMEVEVSSPFFSNLTRGFLVEVTAILKSLVVSVGLQNDFVAKNPGWGCLRLRHPCPTHAGYVFITTTATRPLVCETHRDIAGTEFWVQTYQ